MTPPKLFCIVVFLIQVIITIVDLVLSKKHEEAGDIRAAVADIFAAISWGMTALWWFYQATIA